MCLSLAEAETIRWIMHLRESLPHDEYVIDGGNGTYMALRSLHNMTAVIDQCDKYKPPTPIQLQMASCLLRFFGGNVWFNYRKLWLLISALHLNWTHERKIFSENLIGRKRRAQLPWKQTPIQVAFDLQTRFSLAFPVSTRVMLGRAIGMTGIQNMKLAFNRFDSDRNEMLDAAELWRLLNSLRFTGFQARKVLAFHQVRDSQMSEVLLKL